MRNKLLAAAAVGMGGSAGTKTATVGSSVVLVEELVLLVRQLRTRLL
jgi:hypothetical protein